MRASATPALPRLRRALVAPVVAAATALLLMVSSSTAAAPRLPAAAAAEGTADWTMMMYAVGDTRNVAGLMVENLAQLTELPEMANANIVVLVDLPDPTVSGAPDFPLLNVGRFETTKMLLVRNGGFEEVGDFGELSMGRPDVLEWFIGEAARLFPAENYGLTLFDHGGAWGGGYIDVGAPEETDLSVAEIREGMTLGMQRAGISRFDLLFHAACLMSNYETASALAPLAEEMVGSEELMFDYPVAAEGMAPLDQGADAATVAAALSEGYAGMMASSAQYGALTAMSTVNGDAIGRLDAALESFADAAIPHMETLAPEIARARAAALTFVVGVPGSEEDTALHVVDLGDFLRQLQGLPPAVQVARDAAFEALRQSVTHQVFGQSAEQATGLSIYLPPTAADYDPDYEGVAPPGWDRFLDAFLQAGASAPPPSGPSGLLASAAATVDEISASGVKVSAPLVAGGAAQVTLSETQVFTSIGGRETLATVLPAYVGAGGEDQVQGVFSWDLTALSDGTTTIPVTAIYQDQSGGRVGTFSGQYTSPEGDVSDVGFRLLLDSTGAIQEFTVASVADGTAAGIELAPGGTLTPYLMVRGDGGFDQVLSDRSVATDALQVVFGKFDAGQQYDLELVVGDVTGSAYGASVAVTQP